MIPEQADRQTDLGVLAQSRENIIHIRGWFRTASIATSYFTATHRTMASMSPRMTLLRAPITLWFSMSVHRTMRCQRMDVRSSEHTDLPPCFPPNLGGKDIFMDDFARPWSSPPRLSRPIDEQCHPCSWMMMKLANTSTSFRSMTNANLHRWFRTTPIAPSLTPYHRTFVDDFSRQASRSSRSISELY
jgi:hypothetical protein